MSFTRCLVSSLWLIFVVADNPVRNAWLTSLRGKTMILVEQEPHHVLSDAAIEQLVNTTSISAETIADAVELEAGSRLNESATDLDAYDDELKQNMSIQERSSSGLAPNKGDDKEPTGGTSSKLEDAGRARLSFQDFWKLTASQERNEALQRRTMSDRGISAFLPMMPPGKSFFFKPTAVEREAAGQGQNENTLDSSLDNQEEPEEDTPEAAVIGLRILGQNPFDVTSPVSSGDLSSTGSTEGSIPPTVADLRQDYLARKCQMWSRAGFCRCQLGVCSLWNEYVQYTCPQQCSSDDIGLRSLSSSSLLQCRLSGLLEPAVFCQDSVYLAHPSQCHCYYQCSGSNKQLKMCPHGLHFNQLGGTRVCVTPENSGCQRRRVL